MLIAATFGAPAAARWETMLVRLSIALSPWAKPLWFAVFFAMVSLAALGAFGPSDPLARVLGDDDYSHWLAFGALGGFAATYPSWRGRAIAYGFVIGAAFGVEAIQHFFIEGRGASVADVANSLIGVGAGFSGVYATCVIPVLRSPRP
jgi:hypothetical protein